MPHDSAIGSRADVAIIGARIRTLDPTSPSATAVACARGTVLGVGEDEDIRALCSRQTEIIDGEGMVVTPGLVDAHIHPFFAESTRGVDLTSCGDLADLLGKLRDATHSERLTDDDWLLGWGMEYGVFAGSGISGELLRDAAGDRPVLLTFMDQHTAVATPRALRLAHVTGTEAFDEGAQVVMADGTPTGELRESAAMDLVRRTIPPLTADERYQKAVSMLKRMNAVGLTGGCVMNGDRDTLDLLRELEERGDLSVRLVVPLWQTPDTSFEDMREQLSLCGERGVLWRGGVAKFFIDGVVDSGTAWLYEPDELGDGSKPFWPDPDRYAEAVRLFAEAGFQCVTHAVGDRAVRAALDAYRAAPAASAPHRIEHIETLQPYDLTRFAQEGVAASMQPLHMQWRHPDGSDSWTSRLGPERAARGFPVRSLLDQGVLVALGSDWPVADLDPRVGMAWARLRRRPGDRGAEAFEPEQRLSGAEAVHGYTAAAAAIVGEFDVGGTISVGKRADLTAFGEDPVGIGGDELCDLPIRLTVVGGRVVYRA